MTRIQVAHGLALAGWCGLACLVLWWVIGVAAPSRLAALLIILVALTPLLLALRGLLRGWPYTHAWAAFLALAYFAHGVVEAYADPHQRWLALLEILFSSLLYLGGLLYARWRSKALKESGL